MAYISFFLPIISSARESFSAYLLIPHSIAPCRRWQIHCHMAQHFSYGSAAVFNEAPELQDLFPAPPGFPRCGSFDLDAAYARRSRERWDTVNQLLVERGQGEGV